MKRLIIIPTMLLFIGCAQKAKPLYSWENYLYTSTEYGMNQDKKEAFNKHKLELEKVIEKNKKVPPGIYAEYGQMLLESDKPEKAKEFFLLEKKIYPESSVFIDRLIAKVYGDKKWLDIATL